MKLLGVGRRRRWAFAMAKANQVRIEISPCEYEESNSLVNNPKIEITDSEDYDSIMHVNSQQQYKAAAAHQIKSAQAKLFFVLK